MSEEENNLIKERRAKLAELRARGHAYPNTFRRNAHAGELHGFYGDKDAAALDAEPVTVALAGRLLAKRIMGKASFAQLRDMTGAIQLFVQGAAVGDDAYAEFKTWDVGDLVGVEGVVMRTKTGELSVRAERVSMKRMASATSSA